MLKTIYPTEAAKLGPIACTYRAGDQSIFGTCPQSCPLLPIQSKSEGATDLDLNYLATELNTAPRHGWAWGYTHYPHPLPAYSGASTLNLSTTDIPHALQSAKNHIPTVFATHDRNWPRCIDGVLFVQCPAETHSTVTCATCGGNKGPLCARSQRAYVIVFVAHGTKKHLVGTGQGGCYGANFPCVRQWERTITQGWDEHADPTRLQHWAKSLPPGTRLRHRIVGDICL